MMIACPGCDKFNRLQYSVHTDEYTCSDCGLVSTVNEVVFRASELCEREVIELSPRAPWIGRKWGEDGGDFGEPMRFQPLHDQILIKPLEAATKSDGGLHIPDSAQRQEGSLHRGKVLAVGKGEINKRGERVPLQTRPGDEVLFYRNPSTEIDVDGVTEKCTVIHEEQYAVAVLEP